MKLKKYPMTEAGKQAIQQELDHLQTQKRQEVLVRIKTARKFCDFREDSEYAAAVQSQSQVEERIAYLLTMLQHADLITANDSCKDTVALGTPVTFMELPDGEHETYTIVGIAEADPLNGTISTESPLAKSLLGRSVGDRIVVKTAVEDMTIQVLSIG